MERLGPLEAHDLRATPVRRRPHLFGWLLAVILAFGNARATVQFVEVSAANGIGAYTQESGMGGGVAAADFDDDGDIDLFVPTAAGHADQLYRNLGNGNGFEEIAAAAGVASTASSRAALWIDYDGDHRLDLAVTSDCWKEPLECAGMSRLRLYRQFADAQFQEVTVAAGLVGLFPDDPDAHSGGLSAGDVNNDGWLDLLVGEWSGPSRMLMNNGDGTFSDAGVGSGMPQVTAGHWQPMMHDFNGDGWLDIYSAIDFDDNRLWVNDGDGTFTDQAPAAGLDNAMNDMGMSLADWDNDGDLDIYVTNIATAGKHNVLLRNDSTVGNLQFAEISQALGVDDGGWGWGTTALDADNDGWLDLAATNGYEVAWMADSSKFFLNSGTTPLAFSDVSATSGFDDTLWGSALIAFDHDRDGDLDMLQTCNSLEAIPSELRLLDNQSPSALTHNFLVVRPRMTGTNHRAIGAIVRITVGTTQMMRLITAGNSFLGQEPAEAFFGLGSAVNVDQVTIEWPNRTLSQLTNVGINQVLTVTTELDTDGDGMPDSVDPDDDNDGVDDTVDCASLDSEVWGTPDEALALALSGAGPTTIDWAPPANPGCVAPTYDTIASAAADDFFAAAICLEIGGSDTRTIDSDPAAPGSIRYYLVRAGSPCGAGSGGLTSSGATRVLRGCP